MINGRYLFPHEPLDQFLKREGLLKTQCLLEHFYLLSNEDITVLVDTVKPRIEQVMFHGRLGTFGNLLYRVEWDVKPWGIFPVLHHKNRNVWLRYTPLDHVATQPNLPGEVIFQPEKNRLVLRNIACFADSGSGENIGNTNMEVSLDGNRVNIHLDYPSPAVWGMGLCINLYPLYRYLEDETANGLITDLDYTYNTDVIVGSRVRLVDTLGRLPILRVDADRQRCHVKAESPAKNAYAYVLTLETEGRVKQNDISIELIPNPVTLKVDPLIDAGRDVRITVQAASEPKLRIDGNPVGVTERAAGVYGLTHNFQEGKHEIVGELDGHRSVRRVNAIGDPSPVVVRIADILLHLQYKEGVLKDFFPFMYTCDTLKPFEMWYGMLYPICLCYGHRVCYSLATATRITGDRKYADALYRFIKAANRVSHRYEDGSLLVPPDVGVDGKCVKRMCYGGRFAPDALNDICRPMNQFEMARACVMAYKAFTHLKETERARECLDDAYHYISTLFRMQRPDGSLAKRYMFHSLQVTSEEGVPFPTPTGSQVIEAIEAMEEAGMPPAQIERVRKFLRDQVDYFERLPGDALSVIAGGEASPNDCSQMVHLCASYIIQYYVGVRREDAERKAGEAFKMALLKGGNYIDKPDLYLAEMAYDMAAFLCEPDTIRAPGKGSMTDFQTVFGGLQMLKFFGSPLGELALAYAVGNRIPTMVLPSGALSATVIDVPGFYYRRENNTQSDCDQSGLGAATYYFLTGDMVW